MHLCFIGVVVVVVVLPLFSLLSFSFPRLCNTYASRHVCSRLLFINYHIGEIFNDTQIINHFIFEIGNYQR